MPVSISQHVGKDSEVFAKTGAFDAILDVDSKLFIDPHLLQATTAPELSESYEKLKKRFEDILRLLYHSKHEGDAFWRQALRRFTFPELRGLCIGYSARGTTGSGMGPNLRERLLRTAKQIVDAGIIDPEIFELIGLIEEDIGPDRISDMVGRIIIDDLRSFTHRVFKDLGVETTPIKDTPYESVINPFSRYHIILLPQDILRDLPIANSWSDIDIICARNRALREQLNALIGDTWKKATSGKKSTLRSVVISEQEVLDDLIKLYRKKPAETYDFDEDRAGQVIWLSASRKYVKEFPFQLFLPEKPTAEEFFHLVLAICDQFKQLVENNALSSLLYDSSGKAKKEEAAQKLFYGIADAYCRANELDISRETNGGRGPVDFKFSKAYSLRTLVEAKLSTNKTLLHGFHTQLAEYQKAERTAYSVFLVIDVVTGSASRLKELKNEIEKAKNKGQRVPEVVFVDAIPKKSASKY